MQDRLRFWGRGLKRSWRLLAGVWALLTAFANYDWLVAHLPEPLRSKLAVPALDALPEISFTEYLLGFVTIAVIFALEGTYQEFSAERDRRRHAEKRADDAADALVKQDEPVTPVGPKLRLEYDEQCSRCLKTELNATGVQATFAVAVRNDGGLRADGAQLRLALVEPAGAVSGAPLGASFLMKPGAADSFTASPGVSHPAAPHLELAMYRMVARSRTLWLAVNPRKESGMNADRLTLGLSLESAQTTEAYSFVIDARDPSPHVVKGSLRHRTAVE